MTDDITALARDWVNTAEYAVAHRVGVPFGAGQVEMLRELLAEVERLREDVVDYDTLLGRQGDLLTATVNVLRGDPPELTTWSHHDVAELAAGLMSERARDRAEVERLKGVLDRVQQFETALRMPADHNIPPRDQQFIGNIRGAVADELRDVLRGDQ